MKAAALAALLACPAGPGSVTPRLSPAPGGLLLSWQEKAPEGAALRFARWDGRAWSEPMLVARRRAMSVNGADFPSVVALAGGGYAAQWIESRGDARDVRVSTSADGRRWSAPRVLHADRSEAEHGFATLAPGAGGGFTAVWLDPSPAPGGPQRLVASDWGTGGPGPERALDARVCDCCSTAAAASDGRLLVAYRDRGESELRDISVVAREGGAWGEPAPVSKDGWTIRGCPVNGPALAADGSRVALAWYTAAGDKPAVKVAFSGDGGRSFGQPVRVDEGIPAGRVDVALTADGAVVSWLEAGERPRLAARAVAGGKAGPAVSVAPVGGRAAGTPRLAAWEGRVIAAWTSPRGVRLSAVDVPAAGAASPAAR